MLTVGSRPEVDEGLLVRELDDGSFSLAAPVDRLPTVLAQLQADGVHLANVEIVESGLWEAFLRLTGRPFDDLPDTPKDQE